MTLQEHARHQVMYTHAVIEGSPREAGRLQAEQLAGRPDLLKGLTSPLPGREPLSAAQIDKAFAFFDRHCPGLNEEIAGFTDALHVSPGQALYVALTMDPKPFDPSGQCSHAVVMPSQTEDGHLRVIRSYEFSHSFTEMRLATTRIRGAHTHLGFSELLFGRYDGLNERGLCVTMSAGAPMAPFEPGGCMFWAVVRTVLDQCGTVDEALACIAEIPLSFNLNLLLADATGQAAAVEMASSHRSIRRIRSDEPYLAVTNHFTQPDMRTWDGARMWNSVARHQEIRHRLGCSGLSVDHLKGLLTDPAPHGLCAYDFSGFFGTLWSEIFDLTAGTAEICFGPPSHNPWYRFDLRTPAGTQTYPAVLPEIPTDSAFWKRLAPGEEPDCHPGRSRT